MRVETFFENFELFVDAPNAVEKMRELVLELAMLGRLVKQDSVDEGASRQLERIAAKRANVKKGLKSRVRAQAENLVIDPPTALPAGWAESKLGDLVAVLNGRAYAKNELLAAGTPVLRVGNLFTSNHWYYSDLSLDPDKYCDEGDLLFAWSASFGPFVWPGPRAIFHYHVWKLDLYSPGDLDKRFLYWFLQNKTQEIKHAGHGVSMVHMTKEKMERLAVALPPLAEQKRIVAKVDELMALCDRLEAQQQERAAKHADLARAAVARFADEPTPANLQPLVHESYGVEPADLRKVVLTLALQGKLVTHDAGGESAADLLSNIARERTRLVAQQAIKRRHPIDPPVESEVPFPVPPAWRWCRLEDLIYTAGDGPHHSPHYVSSVQGVPFLSTRNITAAGFRLTDLKHVSHADHAEFCRKIKPAKGDILYTKGGTTGVALVNDLDFDFSVWVHVAVLKIAQPYVDPRYVSMALNSPHCYEQSQRYTHGIGNRDLGLTRMVLITVPLPPLAEQRRIVAKVDQFMTLIDRLEVQLAESRTAAERLMEAVVAELTRSPLDREEVAAVEEKPNPAARTAAAGRFACYVLQRLRDDPELGRTKLEKCNHLAESHCGVPLDRHAIRGAHGPVDYPLLKDAERWADEQGGFTTDDPGDGGRVTYAPGPALATHVASAEAWLGERKAAVDRLLELLAPLDTRQCEVVATAYAAWNDLLIAGASPNDRDIIREAKHHWHEKKAAIPDTQWFKGLRWLEHHRIVPRGDGRPVARLR